jgi:hypothetical protein
MKYVVQSTQGRKKGDNQIGIIKPIMEADDGDWELRYRLEILKLMLNKY